MSASLAGIISLPPRRSVIGRAVMIEHAHQRYHAHVLDNVADTNLAKRVRIQSPGALQGKVLVPGEYAVTEFLD